ncbi:MAG: S-layer family protein [Calothrix sp. SM1_7_51]|nr:S-layer family protein [Calothrix sp. SM1_7_51]
MSMVSSSNQGSGTASNIQINANLITLDNQATIQANTLGGQGNINLSTKDLILRRNSNITTSAKGSNVIGGNIIIDTGNLVTFGLENSNINANSVDFRGGNVTINAASIFGIQFREQETQLSDITASGKNSSLNGTVQINLAAIDPSSGLIELPKFPQDSTKLIAQTCSDNENNSFVITGRGGLPSLPSETLRSNQTATFDWVTFVQKPASSYYSRLPTPPSPLIEATGWITNNKGQVILVADASTLTDRNNFFSNYSCGNRK